MRAAGPVASPAHPGPRLTLNEFGHQKLHAPRGMQASPTKQVQSSVKPLSPPMNTFRALTPPLTHTANVHQDRNGTGARSNSANVDRASRYAPPPFQPPHSGMRNTGASPSKHLVHSLSAGAKAHPMPQLQNTGLALFQPPLRSPATAAREAMLANTMNNDSPEQQPGAEKKYRQNPIDHHGRDANHGLHQLKNNDSNKFNHNNNTHKLNHKNNYHKHSPGNKDINNTSTHCYNNPYKVKPLQHLEKTQPASPTLDTKQHRAYSDPCPTDPQVKRPQTLHCGNPGRHRAISPKNRIPDLVVLRHLVTILQSPNMIQHYALKKFKEHKSQKTGKISQEELIRLVGELHQELGVDVPPNEKESQDLARVRMRRFDVNGDGELDESEFVELYRWTLWRRYEQLEPPTVKRKSLISKAHTGTPNQYYQIGKKLGEGSFGIVHKVTGKSTGVDRVLKTISKERAVQQGTPVSSLREEIGLLSMLDHPHILKIFEHYEDRQNVYMIMDVCKGGELIDVMKRHFHERIPFTESWVAQVFSQITEAIGYCHSKGMMHKDLKFENIMLLDKEDPVEVHVVVIDVGLAELFGAEHGKSDRSTLFAGSLATMGPGVLRQNFCYKCDIWSLGCMLFAIFNKEPQVMDDGEGGEILYGYPFMPAPTKNDPMGIQSMLNAQTVGPPMEKIAHVSHEAQQVVRGMLTFDEQARPTALEILQYPWFSQAKHDLIGLSDRQIKAFLDQKTITTMRRTSLMHAATEVPAAKLVGLSKVFRSLDKTQTGYVTIDELVRELEKAGVGHEEALSVAKAADMDKNGKIEWSEFVAAVLPSSGELFAVTLQATFQKFDKNPDGGLDRHEITELLESGEIAHKHISARRSVDMIMQELDKDGNGRVSFSEFQDYILHGNKDG